MPANYRLMARRAAKHAGLDPDLFVLQIQAESGFNPNARSPVGARGIAQIMPATARGWGVDPMNPQAALNAAARNMANYVKKYGSYENALRAYNAGPGNIEASHGFQETNNYVNKILGASKDAGNDIHATTHESSLGAPGTPGDASQESSLYDVIRRMNPTDEDDEGVSNLWDTVNQLKSLRGDGSSPSSRTSSASPTASPGVVTAPDSGGGGKSLYELFYDPVGGWKNGQSIGAIGGHSDHLHVATDPRRALWIGNQLKKRFGLDVRENPAFEHVDPVHAEGSYHYKTGSVKTKHGTKTVGEALDASGARMPDAVAWLRRKYKLK